MKKVIYSMLALAAMMFTYTSCTNEDTPVEEYVQVSYTAKLPNGIASRAISDGMTVTHVACAVYDVDNGNALVLGPDGKNNEIIELSTDRVATFTPTLIKGRNYRIAFWAYYNEEGNSPAYDVLNSSNQVDLTKVTKNGSWLCNDETADAFTAVIEVKANEQNAQPVTLKRPFARLRFGMTQADWDNTTALVATPTHSNIELENAIIYTSFNALTGEPIEENTISSLGINKIVDESYTVKPEGGEEVTYKTLAYAYVWMPAEEDKRIENVTVGVFYREDNAGTDPNSYTKITSTTIPSVPMEEGYNTNVSGNLLTGNVTYTITIDPSEGENKNENI